MILKKFKLFLKKVLVVSHWNCRNLCKNILDFSSNLTILIEMKLSEYARKIGVSYKTAWNWFKAGKLPNARQLPSGQL